MQLRSRLEDGRRPAIVDAAGVALLSVAVAVFVVGLVVGLFVVGRHGGGPIQAVDTSVGHWFVAHRGPLVGVSKLIAIYLDAAPLAVVAIVIAGAMFVRMRSLVALIPVVAYVGGEFEVFALREVIHRPRPPTAEFPHVGAIAGIHETSYSFPSGHAVAVTAVVFALMALVTTTHRRWWPYAIAACASLFVADSRLVLGVHFLSDVVFGVLAGVGWGVTVTKVFCRLESRMRQLPPS